jgi:hypothetical protein
MLELTVTAAGWDTGTGINKKVRCNLILDRIADISITTPVVSAFENYYI